MEGFGPRFGELLGIHQRQDRYATKREKPSFGEELGFFYRVISQQPQDTD